MKKKIVSLFLCLFMVVSFFPASALAASIEEVPKSIGAPVNVGIAPYVEDGVIRWFEIGFSGDSSVRKFGELEENGDFEELGLNSLNLAVQLDYKYNEAGSWHYESSWDEPGEAPFEAGCSGALNSDSDSMNIQGNEMDPVIESKTDLDNNTLFFRARFVLDYYNSDSGEDTELFSPWSDVVMIGKNDAQSKVTSIEAPTLVKAELKKANDGRPYFEITTKIPESVKTLNNGQGSICQYTSVRKNGGSWLNETGTSAGLLQEIFEVEPEDIGGAGEVNIEEGSYDIRVRFGYSSVYAGDIELYSPYSNVVTIGTSAYTRLSGQTRIDTAIAVSQEGWPNSAETVILTRDDLYPDALAGTPLSKKLDAPILFTNRLTLTPATGVEIARLNPKKVVILGGTVAVSQEIENGLKEKYFTQRIGGYDMYETAEKIALELGYKGKAVIATGEDFHDALIAAPLAAYQGIPMLLTARNALPSYTKDALDFIAPTETIIVGTRDMVSDEVMSKLTNAKRYSGSDYYQTAVIAAENFGADVSKIFFATGRDFPDALTGSALAAKFNNPILFVNEPIADSVKQFLIKNKSITKEIRLLGGEAVIPSSVVNEIMQSYQ
ncbi:cell wall-binding repeat-containing protein [Desulfosporosinus orientis]|nr:cell wall-binding repeat-containing protein [Desulfosporosinus orientis]